MFYSQFDTNLALIPWIIASGECISFLSKVKIRTGFKLMYRDSRNTIHFSFFKTVFPTSPENHNKKTM